MIAIMYVQLVCPLFMWAKASKEALIFENNFKASMQMILALTNEAPNDESLKAPFYDSEGDEEIKADGVPSIISHTNSVKFRGGVHVENK